MNSYPTMRKSALVLQFSVFMSTVCVVDYLKMKVLTWTYIELLSVYANNSELITLSLTFPSAYVDLDTKPFVCTKINPIKVNETGLTVAAIMFYAWNVIWR